MTIAYEIGAELHCDDFADFANWHHEGIGEIKPAPDSGMRLHCFGSVQGGCGCMAFFRHDLPDRIAIDYELTLRSTGGLVINYVAIRGLSGEDLITNADKLPPRDGRMSDYWKREQGLQSYHVSICRFDDKGKHTGTSNWRRNPGGALVGHGEDLVTQINRDFRIRITKDGGACQLFVDGTFAHGFVDWSTQHLPVPDQGKFGFRLIGSDVMADIRNFRVSELGERNPRELAFAEPYREST